MKKLKYILILLFSSSTSFKPMPRSQARAFGLISKYGFELRKGIYRHYKGHKYQVLDIVRHSETLEPMVLYRALYGERDLWVRPLKMFQETVETDGQIVERFKFERFY